MIDFSSELNFLKPEVQIDYNKVHSLKATTYDELLEHFEKRYKIKTPLIDNQRCF